MTTPAAPVSAPCELCAQDGGTVLWHDGRCRVVLVDEPGYPGFCRVIWNAHVREMTDLAPDERAHVMTVVFAVERALRDELAPGKVNLASLGNLTPHVHWHVIPRHTNDPHFPSPIWAAPQRAPARWAAPDLAARLGSAISREIDGGDATRRKPPDVT
jgi:diadenosine tetraphosphate (Ap4A) HIT family hydrolase